MDESVKIDIREGIARISLNRPKAFNAFNLEMIQSLSERLIELARD